MNQYAKSTTAGGPQWPPLAAAADLTRPRSQLLRLVGGGEPQRRSYAVIPSLAANNWRSEREMRRRA
jgi:hypothetical protein